MVMAEIPQPRTAHILIRGQYDKPGDAVETAVPAVLSPLPADAPRNRLGLARWLTQSSHPLTARVAVNRFWGMYFGTGLVETAEDFGVQGEQPSHPELLDWLAAPGIYVSPLTSGGRGYLEHQSVAAVDRHFGDVSAGVRYLAAIDRTRSAKNRLLARGPRFRMPAETVRDCALAISGLLREKLGGPSVKPYQPAGIWEDVSVERRAKYVPDKNDGLYRRSMYTFWKRTCPPPGMTAFDAPDRETCLIRRARTNTPLQALVLLNDPTYVESARCFAERIMNEAGPTPPERLNHAIRLALARRATADEEQILLRLYEGARERFGRDKAAAEKLIAVGESAASHRSMRSNWPAWTTLCSIVLNLDETMTKE